MEFSKKLKQLRVELNITQAELAKRSGTTPAAISHFEAGIRKPTVDILKNLALVLGVTVDELVGLKDHLQGKEEQNLAFRKLSRDLNESEIDEVKKYIEWMKVRDQEKRKE